MSTMHEIWRTHVLRYFRGTRYPVENDLGALTALETDERDFLGEQLNFLADHMAQSGEPVPDRQILELACLAPGNRRGINPPTLVLQPERGGFSEPRLKEAAGSAERMVSIFNTWQSLAPGVLEEDLSPHDKNNVIAVLSAAEQIGRTTEKPDMLALYAGLPQTDGPRLATKALELLKYDSSPGAREVAEDVLWHLACLTEDALVDAHEEMASLGLLYPGILYRGAGNAARQALLGRLPIKRGLFAKTPNPESDHSRANSILRCLAWIGDREVQQLFAKWTANPPHWASNLQPTSEYAMEAGWELDESGSRRQLYFDQGYRLTPGPEQSRAARLGTLLPRKETCPQCSIPMVSIIDIDIADQAFAFLNLSGSRLTIPVCMRCAAYGTVFADVDLEGNGTWSAQNVRPTHLDADSQWDPFPADNLALGTEMITSWEGELQFGGSRTGGHPAWVQYPEYPICPGCSRHMPFVAQIDLEDVDEYGEGNYYVFHCGDCEIAATGYQQT